MIENDHWYKPKDRESTFEGRQYRSWDGGIYILDSHHDCGYHMRLVDASGMKETACHSRELGAMECISARAIDGTWFETDESVRERIRDKSR